MTYGGGGFVSSDTLTVRVRQAEVDQTPPGSSAKSGHAYPSHTTSAATSMMTVSANKSRSHEFMPQNGRAEGENASIAGPCVLDH